MNLLYASAIVFACVGLAIARPPATRPARAKPPTTAPGATGSESAPGETPTRPTRPAKPAARGGSGDAGGGMVVTPYPTRATSSLVAVEEGALPIIISAPHGGTSVVPGVPKRTGVGVDQFETVTDTNTRQIAEKLVVSLQRELGAKPYSVIAKFDRDYIDANRDAKNAYESPNAAVHYWAYHQPLQRFCDLITQKYGRGLIIDIHGQGQDANVIYRGTRSGLTVQHLVDDFGIAAVVGPNSVIGQMQQRGYAFEPVPTATGLGTETSFNGGFITYAYGAVNQASMDSIQFEIGGTFRGTQPDTLTAAQVTARQQKTADDLAASIAVFVRAYYAPKETPVNGD